MYEVSGYMLHSKWTQSGNKCRRVCIFLDCTHCCKFSERSPGNINWRNKDEKKVEKDKAQINGSELTKEIYSVLTYLHNVQTFFQIHLKDSEVFCYSGSISIFQTLLPFPQDLWGTDHFNRQQSQWQQYVWLVVSVVLPHLEHEWWSWCLPAGERQSLKGCFTGWKWL